jgi:hypothetical protein
VLTNFPAWTTASAPSIGSTTILAQPYIQHDYNLAKANNKSRTSLTKHVKHSRTFRLLGKRCFDLGCWQLAATSTDWVQRIIQDPLNRLNETY